MKALILATAIAAASLVTGSHTAQAGQFYGGNSYNYGYASPQTTSHRHHGVSPWGNPGRGRLEWHNTIHIDYQPARTVRHYNHIHYQPGGYYLHQTGHYDLQH